MKWIGLLVVVVLVIGSWALYSKTGGKIKGLEHKVAALIELGDPEDEVPKVQAEINSLEGEKTFNGILLAFLSAGLVGVLFVVFVLPAWAQRMTHSVYDSGEEVEETALHEARSLIAQGDYENAIEAFKRAAAEEPLNRVPWVEISKIQKQQFHDTPAAIQTLRTAVEGQEWEINDAAFFLFRLAELYDEVQDRSTAVVMLRQVIDQFPDTRHSANARHKLHEWHIA
jgi:tetratricopeptide (TPR) repeat protein